MPWEEFEQFVADLLRAMGFKKVSLTPITGDEGKDIVAYLPDPLGNLVKYYVECKHWGEHNKVGRPVVQRLHSVITEGQSASKGIIVTSSDFTDPAKEWAKRVGNIDLIDGERLVELASRYKVLEKYLPKESAPAPVSEVPPTVLGRPMAPTRKKSATLWPVIAGAILLLGCPVFLCIASALFNKTRESALGTICDGNGCDGDTQTRPADGMVMVYVPAGEFEMGSDDDDVDYALQLCNEYYGDGCPSFSCARGRKTPRNSLIPAKSGISGW